MHALRTRTYISLLLVTGMIFLGLPFAPSSAQAANSTLTAPLTPGAVTFTFDDARLSIYTVGAKTLKKYGMRATYYGNTDYLNDSDPRNMHWKEVESLATEYKWEIGNHTAGHKNLTTLSDAGIREQLATAHLEFLKHKIKPVSFAYPFGATNDRVKSILAEFYPAARGTSGVSNKFPANTLELKAYRPRNTETAESVIAKIDAAAAKKEWVILFFHDLTSGPAPEFDYPAAEFEKIVKHVASKKYLTPTIAQALLLNADNKVENGDFKDKEHGWAEDWTRSSAQAILLDEQKNGAAPDVKRSVLFDGSIAKDVIRSKHISVNARRPYLVSAYLEMKNFVQGSQGFWINEFDAEGKNISGQFMFGTLGNYIGFKAMPYIPSSPEVKKIEITFYTNANANLDLILDSVSLKEYSLPSEKHRDRDRD